MSTPVVVQGTPVAAPYHANTTQHQYNSGGAADTAYAGKGEKQETRCRDPVFALLFYGCVAAIAAVAALYGPDALNGITDDNANNNGNTVNDYTGYVIAVVIIVVLSFAAAGLGMAVMMCIPETLIKISLFFVVALSGAWMVMAFLSGSVGAGIIGAIFFALTLCYARAVWGRIPFASANLTTACTAIKSNCGVTIYAYILTALAGGWSILWSLAFAGVFDKTYSCDENNVCTNVNYGYLFLLFLAFFFGHQVLQNCVHVTVAGVVGTWWFSPEEGNHCCSSAVNNSFIRTMTTSFGSICFGSLIVAILQALRALANAAQDNGDGNILACIAECILACLASLVEYFNKWAFIYVGLYGYSYLEAGKNVFTLFRNRGWEAVIADDLVGNTLFLVAVVVGGVMGSIGLIIEVSSDLFDDAGGDSKIVAFVLGFFVGLVIASILFSTVGSGVNAVIVLFAEAPAEFQQNYPELSQKMREAWSLVYPGSV